jgi:hypothetical protein
MRTVIISAALTAGFMASHAIAGMQPNWVPNFTGWCCGPPSLVNQDAIVGGHGGPQMIGAPPPLFPCATNNGVATYLGVATPLAGTAHGGCRIDFGGVPQTPDNYKVLVPAWLSHTDVILPSNATYRGGRGAARPGMTAIPLYFCRAPHWDGGIYRGMHPGKIGPGLQGCLVPYGTKEYLKTSSYDVLVDLSPKLPLTTYDVKAGEAIPPDALVGGWDTGYEKLYICLAPYYNGAIVPGKTRPELNGCNIPWAGNEITVPAPYQVLVPRWRTHTSSEITFSFPVAGPSSSSICRGSWGSSLLPGELPSGWKSCRIIGNGGEQLLSTYEVLSE